MKVIILTEGGKNGGLGHISRCISISQAFEEKKIETQIIVNGDDSVKKAFKEHNYRIRDWLNGKNECFKLTERADIVIVDSYLAGISFYKELSESVRVPVYIDDYKRLDYPRGIVINSSICAEKLEYPKKNGMTYLLGIQYAPLRKLFWEVSARETSSKIKSVMVTTGGNDPENVVPKIVGFLRTSYPDLKKNIIIGNAFHNIDEIKNEVDKNTNLIFFPDLKEMKNVMQQSDIAISSGGQTLYELARMGVPTIAFCQSDNQRLNLEGWEKEGFIEYAGGYDRLKEKISLGMNKLALEQERDRRSRIGMRLVCGQGPRRIVEVLLNEQ